VASGIISVQRRLSEPQARALDAALLAEFAPVGVSLAQAEAPRGPTVINVAGGLSLSAAIAQVDSDASAAGVTNFQKHTLTSAASSASSGQRPRVQRGPRAAPHTIGREIAGRVLRRSLACERRYTGVGHAAFVFGRADES
jgi:hypothetical protein